VVDKLVPLLGIFQKLLASMTHDNEGFNLLQTMIQVLPQESLQPFMNTIFKLLFQRLTSSSTDQYVQSLLVFFFLYSNYYGTVELIESIERVQLDMFSMVLRSLVLRKVRSVSGNLERKICAVGLTKLLCETPDCYTGPFLYFFYNFFFIISKITFFYRTLPGFMG